MADTFAPWLRRRPQALQAPRPIAQAWGIRPEGITDLEAGRLQAGPLPDCSPSLGSMPPVERGAPS